MKALLIESLRDGGYIVREPVGDAGYVPAPPLFAATNIEDALSYIRDELHKAEQQARA